jgi:hypothetical protein
MVDQWYFAWGEHKFGPFTSIEMKQLADIGRLQPDDTVWKEGVETGVAASRIKNLFKLESAEAGAVAAPPAVVLAAVETAVAEPEVAVDDQAEEPTAESPSLSDSDYPMPLAPDVAAGGETADAAEESAPPPKPVRPAVAPPTKATVMGVRGGTLISQDGRVAQIRKKCDNCKHEDASRSTIPIRNGTTRSNYFCPKCRKMTPVEIRGKT